MYNFEYDTLFFFPRYDMSLEVIKPPSKEVQDKVRNAFGLSEETIRDTIEQLREWLEYQPHLPKEIGTFSISA
jgi:hypothetical protein